MAPVFSSETTQLCFFQHWNRSVTWLKFCLCESHQSDFCQEARSDSTWSVDNGPSWTIMDHHGLSTRRFKPILIQSEFWVQPKNDMSCFASLCRCSYGLSGATPGCLHCARGNGGRHFSASHDARRWRSPLGQNCLWHG